MLLMNTLFLISKYERYLLFLCRFPSSLAASLSVPFLLGNRSHILCLISQFHQPKDSSQMAPGFYCRIVLIPICQPGKWFPSGRWKTTHIKSTSTISPATPFPNCLSFSHPFRRRCRKLARKKITRRLIFLFWIECSFRNNGPAGVHFTRRTKQSTNTQCSRLTHTRGNTHKTGRRELVKDQFSFHFLPCLCVFGLSVKVGFCNMSIPELGYRRAMHQMTREFKDDESNSNGTNVIRCGLCLEKAK